MKSTVRKRSALAAFALSALVAVAACGKDDAKGSGASASPTEANGAKEKVEIVFQSWITPNLTAEYYDNSIKAFEAANPGIKVKRIAPNSNDGTADNYLKTLLAAGDFPDVIENATTQVFVDANALMEIPIDNDIRNVNNYENSLINGKLYVVSAIRQPQGLIFYNKKLFEDAGIAALPKTWDELQASADKLKARNVTPFIVSGDWSAGFNLSDMMASQVFKDNPAWYKDRWDGKVHFTDPGFIEGANFVSGMVKKGYFNKGGLGLAYADAEKDFLAGKAAMYPMGSWFTAAESKAKKDFEVGVFAIPTKDGKPFMFGNDNQSGYSVSKTSKHPEAALKFAKYMMFDKVAGKAYLQADGLFSSLKEPIVYDMTPLQKEIFDILKNIPAMTGGYSNKAGLPPVSGIQDQWDKVAQSILLAPNDVDVAKEMKSLDDFWDKNAKK